MAMNSRLVDTFGGAWVFNSLLAPEGQIRSRIGMIDTILYENAQPALWLFTNRSGEVVKKRTLASIDAIRDRFSRLALAQKSNVYNKMAFIRFRDNSLQIVDAHEFLDMTASWPLNDSNIVAIQGYVQSRGNAGTVYRNTYDLASDKGKVITTTQSYITLPEKERGENRIMLNSNEVILQKSNAGRINSALDKATEEIVRYIEARRRTRVLHLTVDYVIDNGGALWFMWCHEARTTNVEDLTTVGVPVEGALERQSWLGDSAKAVLERETKQRTASPDRKGGSRRGRRRQRSRAVEEQETGEEQIAAAASNIEGIDKLARPQSFHSQYSPTPRKSGAPGKVGGSRGAADVLDENLTMSAKHDSDAWHAAFVTREECNGDYCGFVVSDAGSLTDDRQEPGNLPTRSTASSYRANAAIAGKLLRPQEVAALRAMGGTLLGGIESFTDGNFQVSRRTIEVARKERRAFRTQKAGTVDGTGANPWDEYPVTPTQAARQSHKEEMAAMQAGRPNRLDGSKKTGGGSQLRSQAPTEASSIRDSWQKDRSGMTIPAANYYEACGVCESCFQVYSLLNTARRALRESKAEEKAEARKRELADAKAAVEEGKDEKFLEETAGAMAGRLASDLDLSEEAEAKAKQDIKLLATEGLKAAAQQPADAELPETNTPEGSPEEAAKRATWKERLPGGEAEGDEDEEERPEGADRAIGQSSGLTTEGKIGKGSTAKLKSMDEYLRGTQKKKRKRRRTGDDSEPRRAEDIIAEASQQGREIFRCRILVADHDTASCAYIVDTLEEEGYIVSFETDGASAKAAFSEEHFDAILVERDLPHLNGFALARALREHEAEQRAKAALRAAALAKNRAMAEGDKDIEAAAQAAADAVHEGVVGPPSIPIICVTPHTAPEDMLAYKSANMDGCVSKPVQPGALLTTLQAALPYHLTLKGDTQSRAGTVDASRKLEESQKASTVSKAVPTSTADLVANSLSIPTALTAADGSKSGALQLDADTTIPYTVMDFSMNKAGARPGTATRGSKPFFNLVVCQDLFDTHERLKIFLKPIAQRYPGVQVLLWNYPGQAFTEWREEQLLNNEYFADCLAALLAHVGERGTDEFDVQKPFYLLGIGNGAAVATYFATHMGNQVPSMRGLIFLNGFAYVDPNLAAVLHDCMNVFSCSPLSRPDLPVYFYARFLFSAAYLAQVSPPLALNLYTAVHNPISLEGRVALCLGALGHVDCRPLLPRMDYPVVCVTSTRGALVKPMHAGVFVEKRNRKESRSINAALNYPNGGTCVVWVNSGHEMIQERRDQVSTLLEQIVVGYHEKHEVAFLPAEAVDPESTAAGKLSIPPGGVPRAMDNNFEDRFVDTVLGAVDGAVEKDGKFAHLSLDLHDACSRSSTASQEGIAVDAPNEEWDQYRNEQTLNSYHLQPSPKSKARKTAKRKATVRGRDGEVDVNLVLNPEAPAFERQDNSVFKHGKSYLYPKPEEFPEVKEYMTWRLKRNRKRLKRLDNSARIVQSAFRSYLAWRVLRNLRETRSAICIQRVFRGWQGRLICLERLRIVWAAQVVQRNWRGHQGRVRYLQLLAQQAAALTIQRMIRGWLARIFVRTIQERRFKAAQLMQAVWRRRQARRVAKELRLRRDASILLQRVYRGHLGRRKAAHEREKYLFSKSQSAGIEFGRQMLLEHKLHATRLQSEVTLLTQEKVNAEEQVEALLEEISEFEEGVATLEKEMLSLSRVETEAVGVLDEESRHQLREQKMRLDKEFSEMLAKIADRKERLQDYEGKLNTLDRARQGKEEELRSLERKLVVLLEEQQRELDAIKQRQERKGESLSTSQDVIMNGGHAAIGPSSASPGTGGGGFVGPSAHEKKQAAQLMQSTETMMKFGFMSMSMTYFSSMNMIKAMRTVGAQDTIMAAVAANQATGANMGGGGGGGGGSGGPGSTVDASAINMDPFKPGVKPGQIPGQQDLRLDAWSVDDVSKWLYTLSLGQYREPFADAAVDGTFLKDLTDDDLRNTLGVEHKLHRKKILNTVARLMSAEAERDRQFELGNAPYAGIEQPDMSQVMSNSYGTGVPSIYGQSTSTSGGPISTMPGSTSSYGSGGVPPLALPVAPQRAPQVSFDELVSWVRHSKTRKVKEALNFLEDKPFDRTCVKHGYVEEFGTAYIDAYERETFNMNKVDDKGNTLLCIAAQNGNEKLCKFFVKKGANADHQNKQGNTPAHFAIAYQFFDLGSWFFSPDGDGAGASDTIVNMYGQGPYDGLAPE